MSYQFNIDDFAKSLIGKTEDEARKLVYTNTVWCKGLQLRVMQKNGTNYLGTCDCNFDRINLRIENDLIIYAGVG